MKKNILLSILLLSVFAFQSPQINALNKFPFKFATTLAGTLACGGAAAYCYSKRSGYAEGERVGVEDAETGREVDRVFCILQIGRVERAAQIKVALLGQRVGGGGDKAERDEHSQGGEASH